MTVQEKIQVVQDARETIAPAPQSDTVQVGSTVMSRREGPAAVIAAVKTVVEERATTTIALFDEDKDGIIDYDEIHIYGTDPKKGDTNEDGISDGASILAGINPSEKNFTGVTYEDAKKVTVAAVGSSQIFEVKKITPKLTVATEDKPEKIESVTFSGRALAHSFVTLYFYSTPIVVTVKTDDTGNWEYTIDRELEDGEHNVYVAMTDSGGKILVKTSPIPFIKTANAITLGSLSAGAAQGGFFQGNMLLIFAGFIVAVIAVAFLVISIILKKDDSTTN
jgi:hypothetical protein